MRVNRGSASFGWVVAVLLVVVAWAGAYALRGGGSGEVMAGWADGMPAGQQLAKEADKPMVVLFTAGWCPPCRALKNNVFTDGGVQQALQAGFVPVQIDLTDQSAANPNMEVAAKYGVRGIPTVLAMTPDGVPFAEYAGGDSTGAFNQWLDGLSQ
ncbi:MAG: thioredoxin fold domain-containing protein [Planctomycetota bacterium]